MPVTPLPAEHSLRAIQATVIRQHRKSLCGDRDQADAAARAKQARDELAESIAAAAPLLTDEQREMLRPLLAGTLNTTAEADQGAA
jgi:dsDNA-binding SOS-regulon protein